MNSNAAKILVRLAGTVAGLYGVGLLCITPLILYRFADRTPWLVSFSAIPFALAVYFIFVAYLAWYRYSPFAVRHVVTAYAFFVTILVVIGLFENAFRSHPVFSVLSFFCSLFIVYAVCRVVCHRFGQSLLL